MTKTIIIGQPEEAKKELKRIEIKKVLDPEYNTFDMAATKPHEWENIELICRNYGEYGYDLIFAYDDNDRRHIGSLYLGHWNDGVV